MTRRLLPLAAVIALAGCEPAPPLAPEAFRDAYDAALLAGGIDGALDLLDAQAEAGDLEALSQLADIRTRGYVVMPWSAEQHAGAHVAIWTWPWDGPLATRRFERTLRDSVDTGSHNALFFLADRHLAKRFTDGEWSTPDPAEAQALYRRLVSEGADPLRLAFLAQRLGDEEAYLAHLREGAEAGHPQACVFLFWQEGGSPAPSPAASLSATLDHIEGCRERASEANPGSPFLDYSDRVVGDLAAQVMAGNPDAVATVDSLRTLGVFERHPRLGALVAEAG